MHSRWFSVVLYGVALCLSLSFIGYGLEWQEFSNTPSSVLTSGGRVVEGRITSIQTWGFGLGKDYFIKVENSPETFMIPGRIADPVDIGSKISKGDLVFISSSGGAKPVILEFLNKSDVNRGKLLDYNTSAKKYQLVILAAKDIGNREIWIGILLFPFVFITRRLWLRSARKRFQAGKVV